VEAGTYVWGNSLGTNATINVSPTNPTTYTVTVTNNNCTATASQTVSVQASPTATISGPTTVCLGDGVTLTANGGNSYTWSTGTSASTPDNTIYPVVTVTVTVTASLGANCTASATQTVTVLQPSASSFSQTICAGSSYSFNGLQLTQNGTYYDTLANSVGCDSVVTLALNVLSPIETILNESICTDSTYNFNGTILTQAGQYFDTIPSAFGCDSAIALNLSISAAPQITAQPTASTSTVCAGGTVTLNVTATGGNLSYQWKDTNVNEGPDAASYTTGPLTSGAKSYTVEVSNSCGSETSNAVSVTVNALPNPTITQTGFDLTTQTFTTYQWQLGGSDINGAQAQNYTATADGNYAVEVTDANGCSAISASVNVTGVGIETVSGINLAIYPNPANEFLIISCDEEIEITEVYNVVGEKVIFVKGQITKLNVAPLAQGMYSVQLKTTKGNTAVKKFVKQ
jgi:hypothetical protein